MLDKLLEPDFGNDHVIPPVYPPKGVGVDGHILKGARPTEGVRLNPVAASATVPPTQGAHLLGHIANLGADQRPLARTGWRYRQFPLGGWVAPGVPWRWQRVDQGQDFEITYGHHIIAPSYGKCIHWLYDREWPSGFGGPYMVVYIAGRCRFQGMFWYLGHDNADLRVRPGEWFHAGDILVRPNHEMNAGWVWTELGHAPNGYPGGFGEGAAHHWRFAPYWRWTNRY